MSLTELAIGLYLIDGTADDDGQPFALFRSANPDHLGAWVIQDSHGRVRSFHDSSDAAVASLEVTR